MYLSHQDLEDYYQARRKVEVIADIFAEARAQSAFPPIKVPPPSDTDKSTLTPEGGRMWSFCAPLDAWLSVEKILNDDSNKPVFMQRPMAKGDVYAFVANLRTCLRAIGEIE